MAVGLGRIRSRELTFGAVWLAAWLVPPLAALRTFEPIYFVQERYLYLPSIGFCLAIALGVEWLARRKLPVPVPMLPAAIAVLTLLILWGAVYTDQNRVWYSTVTLFENAVTACPREPLARTALASQLFLVGRKREAADETRTALDIEPTCIDAYLRLTFLAHSEAKST